MSEEDFTTPPSGPESNQPPAAEPIAAEPASWGTPQPNYGQTGYPPPPPPPPGYTQAAYPPPPQPGYGSPPVAAQPLGAQGLSENAACALAYVTFIPALIFLLVAPYNQNPKIKFHAIQMLALSVVGFVVMFGVSLLLFIPILGFLIYLVTAAAMLGVWVMCIYKASQGSAFKLPFIGDFAAQQSGYHI
jgi:uncharacterized membrane protein